MDLVKLGKKLRAIRQKRGLTQNDLAKGIVTRNMLSLIETGKASPSLEVLLSLSSTLGVDASYLISDKDECVFEKIEIIDTLKSKLARRSYALCLSEALSITDCDDEVALIIATCAMNLGKECVKLGQLKKGISHLTTAREYSARTVYSTKDIEAACELYLSIAKNIQSPLIELDLEGFRDDYYGGDDIELLRYLAQDFEYEYKNPLIRRHVSAKSLIRGKKYTEALEILLDIANNKKKYGYNAFVIFSVYSDIEYVMRELLDFEGAYRYSTKRISMLSSFNA